MSSAPPPPPSSGGPPPPPPGYGPPGGNRPAGVDVSTINPLDWGILGAGFLAFVFSLFNYYTIDVTLGGFGSASASYSAWHGFFGWFAALLAVLGAAAVAVSLFAPQVHLPVPARLAGLGLSALATLCVILALFVVPDGGAGDTPGVDSGHGFSYWISLLVIIAGLVLSLMRFQATGGQLPGALGKKVPDIGGYGPQGGPSGHPVPPPPGSAPPPPPGSTPQPPTYGPPQ